jgi:hypothetical protein
MVIPQPRTEAEMNTSAKAAEAVKSFRIVLRAVAVFALVVAAAVTALAAYNLNLPWAYVSAVVVQKMDVDEPVPSPRPRVGEHVADTLCKIELNTAIGRASFPSPYMCGMINWQVGDKVNVYIKRDWILGIKTVALSQSEVLSYCCLGKAGTIPQGAFLPSGGD